MPVYARVMLFRWLKGEGTDDAARPNASEELKRLVARSLDDASAETAAVIGAVAGLLAFVAYADRSYSDEERASVATALGRMHALPAHAVDAISELLSSRIRELAAESLPTYTRVLYELTERDARLELLDVLMDLAAADDVLSMDETNGLRRIAKLLGLSEDEYLAAQARHRGRLSVLHP